MSLTTRQEIPVLMGMEIEANWQEFQNLPKELQEEYKKIEPRGSAAFSSWRSYFSGNRAQQASSGEMYAAQYFKLMPEKFQFPEGWFKTSDGSCGMEMFFDGPVQSLEQAEGLAERASTWLDNHGIKSFDGAGTHVHLGTVKWLDDTFGKLDVLKACPVRQRAARLLHAYFLCRETALMKLVPQRRMSGYSLPAFAGNTGGVQTYMDASLGSGVNNYFLVNSKTPLWAVHNSFLLYPSVGSLGLSCSSIVHLRKGLPTTEFRIFPGCSEKTALIGYLRLVNGLFQHAAKALLNDFSLLEAKDESYEEGFLYNPFKFTIADLKKEFSDDPWMVAWIDRIYNNNGNPISDVIPETASNESASTEVACAR